MLIFGGLMLNLVASGMLLRPIKVKPRSISQTAPIQKSPAISLKSSSEKESAKRCLNGSSHVSNGVPKSAPFQSAPPTPQGDTEKQGSPCRREPQEPPVNPELGREAQQHVGSCRPPAGSAQLSGGLNGSAVAACPPLLSTQGETTAPRAKLLDFSLLKDPFFCIYTWSLVFSQLAYFIPYFHLSARARTLDIDAMEASFIISVAGESSASTHVSFKDKKPVKCRGVPQRCRSPRRLHFCKTGLRRQRQKREDSSVNFSALIICEPLILCSLM